MMVRLLAMVVAVEQQLHSIGGHCGVVVVYVRVAGGAAAAVIIIVVVVVGAL